MNNPGAHAANELHPDVELRSPVIEKGRPLAYLVREGVGVDFGCRADILTTAEADAIHAA